MEINLCIAAFVIDLRGFQIRSQHGGGFVVPARRTALNGYYVMHQAVGGGSTFLVPCDFISTGYELGDDQVAVQIELGTFDDYGDAGTLVAEEIVSGFHKEMYCLYMTVIFTCTESNVCITHLLLGSVCNEYPFIAPSEMVNWLCHSG